MNKFVIKDIEFILSSENSIYANRQLKPVDCGLGYAESLNLKAGKFSIDKKYEGVFIIDTLIQEKECKLFYDILKKYSSSIFIFKIVDPYFEHEKNKYFFKFLFNIAKYKNVFFLSTYHFAEATLELDKYSGQRKMIFLPYPYLENREIEVEKADFFSRQNKLFYSGAVNTLIYPNRTKFLQLWRKNPLTWNKIQRLKHPGYKDIGNKVLHDVVGDEYIRRIAGFRNMYLDSSRVSLEFLKFGECAYANSLPFGEPPLSFDKDIEQYFIKIDYKRFTKSIRQLVSMPADEAFEIASGYKRSFRQHRNKELLQSKLLNFINNISL